MHEQKSNKKIKIGIAKNDYSIFNLTKQEQYDINTDKQNQLENKIDKHKLKRTTVTTLI